MFRLRSGITMGKNQQNPSRDGLASASSTVGTSNPQVSDDRITLIVDNTRWEIISDALYIVWIQLKIFNIFKNFVYLLMLVY